MLPELEPMDLDRESGFWMSLVSSSNYLKVKSDLQTVISAISTH